MRPFLRLLFLACFLCLAFFARPASAADRVTILYDAFGDNQQLTRDWGLGIERDTFLRIQIVRDLQPLLHFTVDLIRGHQFDAMRDAVFFCQTARINNPFG